MKVRLRMCLFLSVFFVSIFELNSSTKLQASPLKFVYLKPIAPKSVPSPKSEIEVFKDTSAYFASKLQVPLSWYLAITYHESQFNPKAKNPYSTATGILQFTASTARLLHTSTAKLRKMTCVEQSPYAYRYFEIGIEKFGKFVSATDMYLWALLPYSRIHAKEPKYVLMRIGDMYYAGNSGLDTNGDGLVQVFEITNRIEKRVKLFL